MIPVIIWVFNRMIGKLNQPGQQGPQQQRGRRMPPAGVPKPNDEVQEFLRRVRDRRREAETVEVIRPAPQQRPIAQPAAQRQPPRDRTSRTRSEPLAPKTPQRPLAESPPPQAVPRPRLDSTIAEHVAHDIDTSDVTEHFAHLTKLDQADEQMEAHIQSAFTHRIGQLESTLSDDEISGAKQAANAAATPSLTAVIRAQLASPQGVRQAVLMREILERPTDRW
jgi:hypothetical protein